MPAPTPVGLNYQLLEALMAALEAQGGALAPQQYPAPLPDYAPTGVQPTPSWPTTDTAAPSPLPGSRVAPAPVPQPVAPRVTGPRVSAPQPTNPFGLNFTPDGRLKFKTQAEADAFLAPGGGYDQLPPQEQARVAPLLNGGGQGPQQGPQGPRPGAQQQGPYPEPQGPPASAMQMLNRDATGKPFAGGYDVNAYRKLQNQPWFNQVNDIFRKAGIHSLTWMHNALRESGGNPRAKGDGGSSYGLFQLHEGGLFDTLLASVGGNRKKALELAHDPIASARVMAAEVKRRGGFRLGQDPVVQTYLFARDVERPSSRVLENLSHQLAMGKTGVRDIDSSERVGPRSYNFLTWGTARPPKSDIGQQIKDVGLFLTPLPVARHIDGNAALRQDIVKSTLEGTFPYLVLDPNASVRAQQQKAIGALRDPLEALYKRAELELWSRFSSPDGKRMLSGQNAMLTHDDYLRAMEFIKPEAVRAYALKVIPGGKNKVLTQIQERAIPVIAATMRKRLEQDAHIQLDLITGVATETAAFGVGIAAHGISRAIPGLAKIAARSEAFGGRVGEKLVQRVSKSAGGDKVARAFGTAAGEQANPATIAGNYAGGALAQGMYTAGEDLPLRDRLDIINQGGVAGIVGGGALGLGLGTLGHTFKRPLPVGPPEAPPPPPAGATTAPTPPTAGAAPPAATPTAPVAPVTAPTWKQPQLDPANVTHKTLVALRDRAQEQIDNLEAQGQGGTDAHTKAVNRLTQTQKLIDVAADGKLTPEQEATIAKTAKDAGIGKKKIAKAIIPPPARPTVTGAPAPGPIDRSTGQMPGFMRPRPEGAPNAQGKVSPTGPLPDEPGKPADTAAGGKAQTGTAQRGRKGSAQPTATKAAEVAPAPTTAPSEPAAPSVTTDPNTARAEKKRAKFDLDTGKATDSGLLVAHVGNSHLSPTNVEDAGVSQRIREKLEAELGKRGYVRGDQGGWVKPTSTPPAIPPFKTGARVVAPDGKEGIVRINPDGTHNVLGIGRDDAAVDPKTLKPAPTEAAPTPRPAASKPAASTPASTGARKTTPEGSKRVAQAREMLKQAINNPDLVGKQRADTISNLKNLVAFHEANASKPLKVEYSGGKEITLTGVITKDGHEEFIYLDGHRAGSYGVRATAAEVEARTARQQQEYQNQQAAARRVAASQKAAASTPEPNAGAKGKRPTLPPELAKSAPRYKTHQLKWESDVDKAIYIVTSQKPSASRAKFETWLKDNGIPEEEWAATGKFIKDGLQQSLDGQPDGRTLYLRDHHGTAPRPEAAPTAKAAAPVEPTPAEPAAPAGNGYGADNKLVSTSRYEELKRLANEGNDRLTSGFDPTKLPILFEMGLYHVEAGARKFADWSPRMIADTGDWVKPRLRGLYENMRIDPDIDTKGFSTPEEVDAHLSGKPLPAPEHSFTVGGRTVALPDVHSKNVIDSVVAAQKLRNQKISATAHETYSALISVTKKALTREGLSTDSGHLFDYMTYVKRHANDTAADATVEIPQSYREYLEKRGVATKPSPTAAVAPGGPQELPKPPTTAANTPAERQARAKQLSGNAYTMETGDISTDAERFQYKEGAGRTGVREDISDPYKKNLAGVISVWYDPKDGKTYVVNGHHRFARAVRDGASDMLVRYLEAPTEREARIEGAIINIADDKGTAIDAAKLFREADISQEGLKKLGVSLAGAIARPGAALARLHESLWKRVVAGTMPVARGVVIGENLTDHADQLSLAKLLGKRKLSDPVVAELVRIVKGAPTTTSKTKTLFGDEELAQNHAIEKAQLSVWLKGVLGADKRLFGYVAREGRPEELGRAGNVINQEESARLAQEAKTVLEVYDKLSIHTGPVADALNSAAVELANGGSQHAIQAKLRTTATAAVEQELGRGKSSQRGATPEVRGGSQHEGGAGGVGTASAAPEQQGLFQTRKSAPSGAFDLGLDEPAPTPATEAAGKPAPKETGQSGLALDEGQSERDAVLNSILVLSRKGGATMNAVASHLSKQGIPTQRIPKLLTEMERAGQIVRDSRGYRLGNVSRTGGQAGELRMAGEQDTAQGTLLQTRNPQGVTAPAVKMRRAWKVTDAASFARGVAKAFIGGKTKAGPAEAHPRAQAIATVAAARAKSWSILTGRAEGEWYTTRLDKITAGGTPDPARVPAGRAALGEIVFGQDGRAVIRAFQGRNISTALHEMGHLFRRDMYASLGEALPEHAAAIQADITTLERAYGVKGGAWTNAQEEVFARTWERYFRDGSAPTPELKSVFRRLKAWMKEIYQNVQQLGAGKNMNPVVRDVFDRFLGGPGASSAASREAARLADARTASTDLPAGLQNKSTVRWTAEGGYHYTDVPKEDSAAWLETWKDQIDYVGPGKGPEGTVRHFFRPKQGAAPIAPKSVLANAVTPKGLQSPPAEPASNWRQSVLGVFGTIPTNLRAMGETGVKLADSVGRIYDRAKKSAGIPAFQIDDLLGQYPQAIREQVMQYENSREMLAIGQPRPPAPSPLIEQLADQFHAIMESLPGRAHEIFISRAGQELRGGGSAYPRIWTEEGRAFLEDIKNTQRRATSERVQKAAKSMADRTGMSEADALAAIESYGDELNDRTKGYLEKFRKLRGLPNEFFEWDPIHTMPGFLDNHFTFVEARAEWGLDSPGVEGHALPVMRAALAQMRREGNSGPQVDRMERALEHIFAERPEHGMHPGSSKIMSFITGAQALGKLGGVIFPLTNIWQRYSNTGDWGLGAQWKMTLQRMNPKAAGNRQWEALAKMSGSVLGQQNLIELERAGLKGAARWATAPASRTEAGNLIGAARVAGEGLLRDIETLRKSYDPATQSIRNVLSWGRPERAADYRLKHVLGMTEAELAAELSGSAESYKARIDKAVSMEPAALAEALQKGDIDLDVLFRAMNKLNRDRNYSLPPGYMTQWFSSNAYGRVATQFMPFQLRQGSMAYEMVKRAWSIGEIRPMVHFIAATALGGALIDYVESKHGRRGNSFIDTVGKVLTGEREADQSNLPGRLLHAMNRGGFLFGMFENAFDTTPREWYFQTAGPTISSVMNYASAAAQVAKQPKNAPEVGAELVGKEVRPFREGFNLVTAIDAKLRGGDLKPVVSETQTLAMDWLRKKGRGRPRPSDPSITDTGPLYRLAAASLLMGDTEKARGYVARIKTQAPDERKEQVVGSFMASMRARGPRAGLSESDWSAFLRDMGPQATAVFRRADSEWASRARAATRGIR